MVNRNIPEISESISFIDGLRNAEDLIHLNGTNWIIASSLNLDLTPPYDRFPYRALPGPLSAIRMDTREVHTLWRGEEHGIGGEGGPPPMLCSHGLNVDEKGPGKFRLVVANHGGRQSVELLDLSLDHSGNIEVSWVGFVLAPHGIFPNAVATLPGGDILLSGNGVVHWHQDTRNWTKIGDFPNSNGIVTSADGARIFVADSHRQTVTRIRLDQTEPPCLIEFNFALDNLRWGDDGYIYVAGSKIPFGFDINKVFVQDNYVCDIGFVVARICPDTMTCEMVFDGDGFPGVFGAATTALKICEEYWIGSFKGDRVMILQA